MKSNLMKVAFVAAIALVNGINVFNAQKTEGLSDVALANVEALAMDENIGDIIDYNNCTRAISWANCYKDDDGTGAALAIKSVEIYQVAVGSPILCKHDRITSCPSGTHEE